VRLDDDLWTMLAEQSPGAARRTLPSAPFTINVEQRRPSVVTHLVGKPDDAVADDDALDPNAPAAPTS
jgi:hypothetical protein